MEHRRLVGILALTFMLFVAATATESTDTSGELSDLLQSLSGKKEITIVVTDSGLGGLSVVARLERKLEECHAYGKTRLIFANALPSNSRPYNQMADTREKVNTFSSALEGFARQFEPDMILIACNTLSVIYPQTEFASQTDLPVVGIVDYGVNSIAELLIEDTAGRAIILGTPTTIESGAHRNALIAQGFDQTRVTVQACDMLESEIQADPTSDMVRAMIEMYAFEAVEGDPLSDSGEVVVALCCTHYGYAREAFADVFSEVIGRPVTVVDPNEAMSAALFEGVKCDAHKISSASVEVVSRAELSTDDIDAIAGMLAPQSAVTASALRHYDYDTNLFVY